MKKEVQKFGHLEVRNGNGYLQQVSTGKYYKIISKKKDDAVHENSYYSVEPVDGTSNGMLSISSESVDYGFFVLLTDEEYKVAVL